MADDTDNDKKITIDSYTGGSDGADLEGCYFKYKKSDATYDFHDKDDKTKCTGLTVGSSCSFQLDEDSGINWTITLTDPCSETQVTGSWSIPDATTVGDQEGGTFNAQAGGGMEDDLGTEKGVAQQNIIIFEIKSDHGRGFGDALIGCFFSLAGDSGLYKFRDQTGRVLHGDIRWTDTFEFNFQSQKWQISSDIATLEGKAHGRWKLLEGITDEVDGGTFQAQAGGGVPEEVASRATA